MDKLGPICRTVEDCALVFNAIYGPDNLDQTVIDLPFNYDPKLPLKSLRIGYIKDDFEKEKGDRRENSQAALDKMRALGVELIPVTLPVFPLDEIRIVLTTEAATAFDNLTRSGQDDWLKQQEPYSWPNAFRRHRFVPAVEYLEAQRIRYLLIQEMAKVFRQVDLFLAPTFSPILLIGNLTGHPCVVLPDGFNKSGAPTSLCFVGKLFGEAELLAAAGKYQNATDFHRKHPRVVTTQ
jgi:Asp-tRNA(Asn)/Glu-tRNA(Gln) amidotransferase A subunit family amidase